MDPDLLKDTEAPQQETVKIPRRVNWEIKDLVHPIVLRRRLLWGAGLALGMLAGVVVVVWALVLRPPTGPALLADVVDAAGGLDSWNAIDDGVFTRTHTRYDETGAVLGEEVERFFFRKTGDFKLLIESDSDYGHVVIGRDDDGYWATKDGDPVNPIVVAGRLGMMCDSEFCTPDCAAGMAFYRFSLPFKLTDPGVIPAYGGKDDLNGTAVSRLEITFDPEVGSDRWIFFVDDKTTLIRKIEHYDSVESDAPPEEIYWSDHQTKYGITFSHQQSYYRSNGTKLEDYTITDVDFDTPVPDELFIRPEKRTVQTVSLQP